MIELELPYPPTINHYYGMSGKFKYIKPKGKAFRREVASVCILKNVQPIEGPVEIKIAIYPPDRRKRDIDNVLKALLDALEKGGAYRNDSQITKLVIEKLEVQKGGTCLVRIDAARKGMR